MEQRGLISPGKGRDPLPLCVASEKEMNRTRQIALRRSAAQRCGTRARLTAGTGEAESGQA